MEELNLPPFEPRLQAQGNLTQIFDPLRRRFVALTPEEWVRQHFVRFLISDKGYPSARLANEISIELNGMRRRCDTVLFSRDMTPVLIIEYKAPAIRITQQTFNQINAYNRVLQVPYVMASNGMTHYCAHLDREARRYVFLSDIPRYSDLVF
ncbi:MAG: type I restriction enzyme HsdR N-terminal domain-containing protein [Bacteroidaceae bacterium]|nr:type I restriction enzyme HsdR N-terminal domain-containing protein [Bacteroidaceae bacterium]